MRGEIARAHIWVAELSKKSGWLTINDTHKGYYCIGL